MITPKVSIPQDLPKIFTLAEAEENWLIFAVGRPDKKGKKAKRPVASDRPYVPVNRDKAACMTLSKALKRLAEFADLFSVEELDEKHKRHIAKMAERSGKKPGPVMQFEGFALGYLAREGSALIGLDFDNCIEGGGVDNFVLGALVEETGAYLEISSSGTGMRAVMPRAAGDERYGKIGEKNDVGFFVSNRAGFAITFDTLHDGAERDESLMDYVVEAAEAEDATTRREKGGEGAAEAVLEFGRIEVDRFIDEIIPLVPNKKHFEDFNSWFPMIRGPREYYEIVDPDRLDDVREALEAWSERWGGGHDVDKFDEVWSRDTDGSTVGMGSWLHYARKAGFSWDEEGQHEPTPSEVDRYVIVGGKFFDAWKGVALDASQMWRLTIHWKMTDSKGKALGAAQNNRLAWLALNLAVFDGIDFDPTREQVWEGRDGPVLNVWRGIERTTGEGHPGPWVDHVNLLYPDEAETLIDWLAFVLQNPGKKVGFAPILIGPERCGKDTILTPLVDHLDEYASANVALSMLEKDHNAGWLFRKLLCVMQESARGRGFDKANTAEKLKTLIAAPPNRIPIRMMQKDYFEVKNIVNLIFLTNHEDALHVDPGSGRYYPMMTDEVPDDAYFDRLWNWLNSGGAESVVSFLMRRKVTLVRERMKAPYSKSKSVIVEASLPFGFESAEEYLQGRQWVSIRQMRGEVLPASGNMNNMPRPFTDKQLREILANSGYIKVRNPASADGRFSVRVEGMAQHHHVYVKNNGVSVELEAILEGLKLDNEDRDKAQRGAHLKAVTPNRGNQIE